MRRVGRLGARAPAVADRLAGRCVGDAGGHGARRAAARPGAAGARSSDEIHELAAGGEGVILGRGAAVILHDDERVLHVLLDGPEEARVRQAMEIEGIGRETAERRRSPRRPLPPRLHRDALRRRPEGAGHLPPRARLDRDPARRLRRADRARGALTPAAVAPLGRRGERGRHGLAVDLDRHLAGRPPACPPPACATPGGEDFENTITVGISRAISAASCSGPEGIAVSVPPPHRLLGEADQPVVERDRRDRPQMLAPRPCSRTPRPRPARTPRRPLRASPRARPRRGGAGRAAARCGPRPRSPRPARWSRRRWCSSRPRGASPTSRITSAARAAARNESCRMSIGVAPAWAARPLKTAARRSTPTVPSTAAAGSSRALEHRALLDVQLEVGARALQLRARLVHLREVDVVAGDDVLEPLALAVLEVADLVDVERARAGRGAEQAAPEARALLVGPVDEAQPDRPLAVGVRAQHLERGEEPERAVEPAARRARSRRASRRSRSPSCSPGRSAHTLPAASVCDLDRQLLELRAHELARLDPLVGPAHAAGAARPAGQLRQLA